MDSIPFQILLASIGVISTIIIAILFKYPLKPEIEKIYEKNRKYSIELLLFKISTDHLNPVNEIIEKKIIHDKNDNDRNTSNWIVQNKYDELEELLSEFRSFITIEEYMMMKELSFFSLAYMKNFPSTNWTELNKIKKTGNDINTHFKISDKRYEKSYLEFIKYYNILASEHYDQKEKRSPA